MLTVGATQGFSETDHTELYFAETVSAVLSRLPAKPFSQPDSIILSFALH